MNEVTHSIPKSLFGHGFHKEFSPRSQKPRIQATLPRVRRDFPWRPATPCSDTEEDPSEPETWTDEDAPEESYNDPPLSPLEEKNPDHTMEIDPPLATIGAEDVEAAWDFSSLEIPTDIWSEAFEVDTLIDEIETCEEELQNTNTTTRTTVLNTRTRVINKLVHLGLISAQHYPEYTGETSDVEYPEPKEPSAVEAPIPKKRGRGPDRKPRKRRSFHPKVEPPKPASNKRTRGPDKKPRKKRGTKNTHPSHAPQQPAAALS